MNAPRSRLPRRALALLVLLVAVGVAAWVVVAPIVAIVAPDDGERDQLVRRWAAYRTAVLSRPALEAELKALRAGEGATPGLLRGGTSALAAASLQNDVKAIVERNGGEILSARTLPATASDIFEKVGVQYELALPLRALEALLYQVETHTPYLFLDSVALRMPENWQQGAANLPEPKLAIRWQVSGYRRVEGR